MRLAWLLLAASGAGAAAFLPNPAEEHLVVCAQQQQRLARQLPRQRLGIALLGGCQHLLHRRLGRQPR